MMAVLWIPACEPVNQFRFCTSFPFRNPLCSEDSGGRLELRPLPVEVEAMCPVQLARSLGVFVGLGRCRLAQVNSFHQIMC